MRVLLFHPAHLPPKDYGGTERLILWQAEALRDAGHSVTIAALEGSILPNGIELLAIKSSETSPALLISRPPEAFDFVHFFTPPGKDTWGRFAFPWCVTINGNGQPGETYPENAVFISRDHAQRHGGKRFVHNGLNPEEFIFNPNPRSDAALFLSRTHWKVKNLNGAMRLCAGAGLPLKIAGGHRPLGLRLKAALTTGQSWIGPVSGEKKARVISEASALVFPILWPEPFGLVMIEALISGTPVIASRTGSVTEIVSNDVGLCLDVPITQEAKAIWIQALTELKNGKLKWDPAQCRDRVLKNFTHHLMAEKYAAIYKEIIKGVVST